MHTGISQRLPRGARTACGPWHPNLATEDSVTRSKNGKTTFLRNPCATETLYVTSRTTQAPSTPSARASRACGPTVRWLLPPVTVGPLRGPRRGHDANAERIERVWAVISRICAPSPLCHDTRLRRSCSHSVLYRVGPRTCLKKMADCASARAAWPNTACGTYDLPNPNDASYRSFAEGRPPAEVCRITGNASLVTLKWS